ncbi:MAG: S8 family serine peptidase [Cyanobacteriota bacterium]|nr:S8 family serine peptidase [Cyanobacteriota bacterium]
MLKQSTTPTPTHSMEPLAFGQIRGTIWNDIDADGTQGSDEIGLPFWTVYLDQNQNGLFDSGETSTTTDADGNYRFDNLAPSTYYVAQLVPDRWEQTYPAIANATEILPQPLPTLTTTNSNVAIETYGDITFGDKTELTPLAQQSGSLVNLDAFQDDARFAGIDGSGFATVILDTGIDLDHPFFGPDLDNDGVADRIVYHYDFADNDNDASDVNGHGSNVSSIVASSDGTHGGMAPGADIIHLKVFKNSGSGHFGYIEEALQWVVENAATYNIASVNMSLGDTANHNRAQTRYGIGDEISALADLDIAVVSAAGNDFYEFNSVQGVSYPAADPNSIAVGAVYDSNGGGFNYRGARAFTRGEDRLTPFSQRHETLTPIFAPGAPITGASPNGRTVTQHGTSQAAPHIAGISVLAQQLAERELGRRLSVTELTELFQETGVTINDGDDEDDNVVNTDLDFKRVDVLALGEAILEMAAPEPPEGAYAVTIDGSETIENIDFGNRSLQPTRTGLSDYLAGDDRNNSLFGSGGDDTIVGGSGADTLRGQNQQDLIDGGADNDRLYGDADDDTLLGGGGSDFLQGGTGNDNLKGEEGQDTLRGYFGNDRLNGGTENDSLYGDADDDTLLGGSGNDFLQGGAGNDDLEGEEGQDILRGAVGNDRLDGGTENDRLFGDADDDTLLGGDGNDFLQGGAGNDDLEGEAGEDILRGSTGNDRLDGGTENDRLFGDADDDTLLGGDGNDFLQGGTGNDDLDGEAGEDTLQGYLGDDNLKGGAGNDRLFGHDDNDTLNGGSGDDRIFGHAGNDVLIGAGENDVLNGGDGRDLLTGVDPDAIEPGIAQIDTLVGGNDGDTFILADASHVYYDDGVAGPGTSDYALIRSFNPSEGDTIQLRGSAEDYQLGARPAGLPYGKAIFTSDGELIGIVQGDTNLNLDSSAFSFV